MFEHKFEYERVNRLFTPGIDVAPIGEAIRPFLSVRETIDFFIFVQRNMSLSRIFYNEPLVKKQS